MKKLNPNVDYNRYLEKNMEMLKPFIGKVNEFPELKLPFSERLLFVFLDTNYQENFSTAYINELTIGVYRKCIKNTKR